MLNSFMAKQELLAKKYRPTRVNKKDNLHFFYIKDREALGFSPFPHFHHHDITMYLYFIYFFI